MTNLEKFLYNLITTEALNVTNYEMVGAMFEELKHVDNPLMDYDNKTTMKFAKTIAGLLIKGPIKVEILKPHLWLHLEDNHGSWPKISCIKIIKKVFGLGLKEAKEESERVDPLFIKETFQTKEEAQKWIDELMEEMRRESSDANNAFLHNFFEIV